MKVLLIKDVYKLGHAGDVKKVADGYGRNYLLPQKLAVLATPGAMKQADHIRKSAAQRRAVLNNEMSGVADIISDLIVTFPAKAGETGKLYGSITTQMIAEAIQEKTGAEIDRRQVDAEPIRTLGEHKVNIRLTVDLIPEVTVIVHREGEAPVTAEAEAAQEEPEEAEGEAPQAPEAEGEARESQILAEMEVTNPEEAAAASKSVVTGEE